MVSGGGTSRFSPCVHIRTVVRYETRKCGSRYLSLPPFFSQISKLLIPVIRPCLPETYLPHFAPERLERAYAAERGF